MCEGSDFSTTLPALVCLDSSHPSGCEVASRCVFFNINLFILFYFCLGRVFVAAPALSLVAVCGLLIAVASLFVEHGLQAHELQ